MRHRALLVLCLWPCCPTARAQTDWTLLTPAVRPPMRAWMGMAYDLVRDRTVVAGGFDDATGLALGDTWEFDGAAWTRVSAANAPARDCMYMAFAVSSLRTVLFGGLDSNFVRLGDTWEYDGATWTQTATGGPSPRVYMPLAYDVGRDRIVGFGGGQTNLPLPIPVAPQLVGLAVHAQGLSLDGGAPNGIAALSNGATLTVGSR